ncbi:hypothetical protein QTP88_025336 [Uroleucon formosanum]
MFTKPPALKSPSIRQPPYSKDVQKQKNKTSPTTPKSLPKPNSLKITSNPKPLHQMLPKNSPNVNTSTIPTSTSNTDTSPLETPNIASEPTSPSNLPPTSSTTSEPTLQNLEAIPNSDLRSTDVSADRRSSTKSSLMDIDQPTGNKRSLPDSFLTHSPPPSSLEPYGNSKAMPAPQNPVTPKTKSSKKKRKRTKNQNQQH